MKLKPALLSKFIASCVFLFAYWSPAADAPVLPEITRETIVHASLFDRIAELNRVQEPELDLATMRTEFTRLMEMARPAVSAAATPRAKIAALNKVLLADRNVAYLSNKYWRDSTLAASLLRGKGNCLSTSTLYVLAGAALDLPIHMVVVPRHAFARWDDGQTRFNIETTNKGMEIPDSEYFSRWSSADPQDIDALGWGQSLDDNGVYTELLRAAAYHRIGENKLEEAIALIEQAKKFQPRRSDLALWRCEVMADMTGRRDEACAKVKEMLREPEQKLPPSVETGAYEYLAHDAAGKGDHAMERVYLLVAFSRAPKSSQLQVLTSLAFCLRALKDFHGAVRYMELAAVMEPQNDALLYNLAILQKNDGRLDQALSTIQDARKINPESWNLQILEAGYRVLNGEREEGMKLFDTLERPRGDVEFFEIMLAWFYAASAQREMFFKQFEHALSASRNTQIFEWIDQDPDLDIYRKEEDFKMLVEKHRKRLLKEQADAK